jgi:hypothetical protein
MEAAQFSHVKGQKGQTVEAVKISRCEIEKTKFAGTSVTLVPET